MTTVHIRPAGAQQLQRRILNEHVTRPERVKATLELLTLDPFPTFTGWVMEYFAGLLTPDLFDLLSDAYNDMRREAELSSLESQLGAGA